MFKKLAIGLLITVSLGAYANNGIYRDKGFNINSHQGLYMCNIYPLPMDEKDWGSFANKIIGNASYIVKNEEGGDGKYISIDLSNGKKIDTPLLSLWKKDSTGTVYGVEKDSYTIKYLLSKEEGGIIIIQNKQKGDEISVLLAACNFIADQ